MSETLKLLEWALPKLAEYADRVDRAERHETQAVDDEHALRAEVERLTEENANLRKSWAELNDTLIATHEELSRYRVPAADGGAVKRVATLATQRNEARAQRADVDDRLAQAEADARALHDALGWAHPWQGKAHRPPSRAVAAVLERLRTEVERLKDERDEARERAKRHQEEIRGTWQVLDGGTPITTGLAGAVFERLRAHATHHTLTDEKRRELWTRMADAYNDSQGNGQEERMAAVLNEVEEYLSPAQVVVTVGEARKKVQAAVTLPPAGEG